MTDIMAVTTCGFQMLPGNVQAKIREIGDIAISPERDFFVFDPEQEKTVEEDDGKTLHVAFPRLSEKVYAILDDYGDAETLSENAGYKVNTQYLVTYMLAQER